MTREELTNAYDQVSDFLIRKEFYRTQYAKALDQELYDYLIILAWKTFILFSYEKLQQTRHLLGEADFNTVYWKKGSLTPEKYALEKYPIDNVFCYNEIEDDLIIDLLKRTYEFEDNYAKKLKVLKTDRNTAAHVAEDTLAATDTQVGHTLDFLLKTIKTIDGKFKNKFLKALEFDHQYWEHGALSESDFKFVLNTKVVPGFKEAASFERGKMIMQFIEKRLAYLDEPSIDKILTVSLENHDLSRPGYNQIIDAGYGYTFFNTLLERSYKLKGGLEKWKEFYDKLGDRQSKYSNIKESLKKHGVNFGDFWDVDEINPDDIPF